MATTKQIKSKKPVETHSYAWLWVLLLMLVPFLISLDYNIRSGVRERLNLSKITQLLEENTQLKKDLTTKVENVTLCEPRVVEKETIKLVPSKPQVIYRNRIVERKVPVKVPVQSKSCTTKTDIRGKQYAVCD